MKIILFPFSRNLGGKNHPKSPTIDWWFELVHLLEKQGHIITQVGVTGETHLVNDVRFDLPIDSLISLINEYDTWIGIDSFGQHLCWSVGKTGVVIWGQSDPIIFGHTENINLLKDRKYLREKQFWLWTQTEFNQEVFVSPNEVAETIGILSTTVKL